jgi:phosphatidylserine/phosphatidylglycerophosphate/cardiolipin synthase-like enzyme
VIAADPLRARRLARAFNLALAASVAAFAPLTHAAGETAGTSAQVLFTPEEDGAGAIISAVQKAKQEILVQAFSFTSKSIARALQRARSRGVQVEVLIDQEQFEKGAAFVARDLLAARVPVFLDARHAAAHKKVMIIDGQSKDAVLFTGSFNFTHAAQSKNAENLLVIRANAALTQRYRENWLRHRAHSTRLE